MSDSVLGVNHLLMFSAKLGRRCCCCWIVSYLGAKFFKYVAIMEKHLFKKDFLFRTLYCKPKEMSVTKREAKTEICFGTLRYMKQ